MEKVQIVVLKIFRNMDTDIFMFCSKLGIYISDQRHKQLRSKTRYQLVFIIIDGTIKAYLIVADKDPKSLLTDGRQYQITEPVYLPGSRRSLEDFPAKLTLLGIQVKWHYGKNGITRATDSP